MRRFLFLSLSILAVLGSALRATAQPTSAKKEDKAPPNLSPGGSELFRGLLNFHKIEPVLANDLADTEAYYSKLIVVVLGLPSMRDGRAFDPTGVVLRTLRAGGSVLIAADGAGSLANYFPNRRTSLRLTGESVVQPNESRCLAGNRWCPFVRPLSPDVVETQVFLNEKRAPGPEWGLFLGLERIATNVPTALSGVDSSPYIRYELAGFPKGTEVAPEGNLVAIDRVLAVGSSGIPEKSERPFRCLVVADPSIFSNQMMAAELDRSGTGTDNLEFANRVATFLRGPDERKKCLFVEAGQVQSRFDEVQFAESSLPDLPPLPIPPLPNPKDPKLQRDLTDSVNRSIDKWQSNDGPNSAIVGKPPSERRFSNVVVIVIIAAACVFALLILRRFFGGRHKSDVNLVPSDTGRVASSGAPGSMARRKEEILQGGNFTGPVREYLRELFITRGLVLPEGEPPRKLPPVDINIMYSQELRKQLQTLWTVTFEPKPKPIGYARWKELEKMIDAVKRAAENDEWRFVPGGRS